MTFFAAALVADNQTTALTAPIPTAIAAPIHVAVVAAKTIYVVGTSILWMSLRLMLFGATAWAGLAMLRGAITVVFSLA